MIEKELKVSLRVSQIINASILAMMAVVLLAYTIVNKNYDNNITTDKNNYFPTAGVCAQVLSLSKLSVNDSNTFYVAEGIEETTEVIDSIEEEVPVEEVPIEEPVEETPIAEETPVEEEVTEEVVEESNMPYEPVESAGEVLYSDKPNNVPNGQGVCDSAKRTYMDYRLVTATNTNNYRVLNSDDSYTDSNTGIRMNDNQICVAVGSYYGLPGDYIDIVLEDGTVVEAIVADGKADEDTDPTNRYQKYDGSVVELIVDTNVYNPSNSTYLQQKITKIINLGDSVE